MSLDAFLVLDNNCDSTAGLTGSATISATTSDPVLGTGSVGMAVSATTEDVVANVTSFDSNLNGVGSIFEVWIKAQGESDTLVNGGTQLVIGDGTNKVGFHLSGSNQAAFRHESGPVKWEALILDSSSLPANNTELSGTLAALNWGAITEIGAAFKTLSKALGGTNNSFIGGVYHRVKDAALGAINPAIIAYQGTSLAPNNFSKIAALDRATTHAFGGIREKGSGIYGIQLGIEFNVSDSSFTPSFDSYFTDTNTFILFENRGLSDNSYNINAAGNPGVTILELRFGTKVGADGGSDGVHFITPKGVGNRLNFGVGTLELDKLLLYGGSFIGCNKGVNFARDAVYGVNHEVMDYLFSDCAMIDAGQIKLENTLITDFSDANGGMLIDDLSVSARKKLILRSTGTGHGVYIDSSAPVSLTLDNWQFENFGGTAGSNLVSNSGSTDAAIFNDSGKAITVTPINGGSIPSVRNGVGATTTVVAGAVDLIITVIDKDTSLSIQNVQTSIQLKDSPFTQLMNKDTDVSGIASQSYTGAKPIDIVWKCRKSEVTDDPRYIARSGIAEISASGLNLTILLEQNKFLT